MPIPNYQIPGVYVTQSGSSLTAVNPTNLNIAIIADDVVQGYNMDTFNNVVSVSGVTIGQLSVPMVNNTYSGTYSTYSGYTVTWTSNSGTTITGAYGTNFNITNASGSAFSYLTTSGISSSTVPSGTVQITYGHNWGAYGNFTEYTQAAQAIGSSISGTTIVHPALLATQLAFQNGANTVSILPVARTSSGTTASTQDWANVFSTGSGFTGNNPIYAAALNNIDVIVPLYGFISMSGATYGQITPYGSNNVAAAITSYLLAQSSNGVYQRAFLGVDGTFNQVTTTAMQALASGFGIGGAGTRVSLLFPSTINYNPGLSTSTGLTNVSFNIPGYYLAAAVAGTFVGQTNVATPITNKIVNGFNYVPNQISLIDAQTNYLPYGLTTVYQKRDGKLWILQGLTTNITNWLTQEISINAIGDVLANQIRNGLQATSLIGGPLTQITAAAALGEVQGQLTDAVANGLIQNYQNLAYTVNPATPTTINITFQYSPTYPINYIQVVLSLNTQTGVVLASSAQSNLVVY